MWSIGCIFAELLLTSKTGQGLFQGKDEVDQFRRIASVLGPPNTTIWPELPLYSRAHARIAASSTTPASEEDRIKRRLEREFHPTRLTPAALDLLFRLLHYDPKQRISAKLRSSIRSLRRKSPRWLIRTHLAASPASQRARGCRTARRARPTSTRTEAMQSESSTPPRSTRSNSTLMCRPAHSCNVLVSNSQRAFGVTQLEIFGKLRACGGRAARVCMSVAAEGILGMEGRETDHGYVVEHRMGAERFRAPVDEVGHGQPDCERWRWRRHTRGAEREEGCRLERIIRWARKRGPRRHVKVAMFVRPSLRWAERCIDTPGPCSLGRSEPVELRRTRGDSDKSAMLSAHATTDASC